MNQIANLPNGGFNWRLWWRIRIGVGVNALGSGGEGRNENVDDGDHEYQSDRPVIDQIQRSRSPLQIGGQRSFRIGIGSIAVDRDRLSLDVGAGNQENASHNLHVTQINSFEIV